VFATEFVPRHYGYHFHVNRQHMFATELVPHHFSYQFHKSTYITPQWFFAARVVFLSISHPTGGSDLSTALKVFSVRNPSLVAPCSVSSLTVKQARIDFSPGANKMFLVVTRPAL
jgi:hypothetical protein